ncbi:hypothetical protein FQR65_LT09126 [Abscondita terminalis]|nr:hypothetical protein FQR65_LT09126 [Abscondita terminalis]
MNRGRMLVDLAINNIGTENEIQTKVLQNCPLKNNGNEMGVPIVLADDNSTIGFIKMTESFRILPDTFSMPIDDQNETIINEVHNELDKNIENGYVGSQVLNYRIIF